MSTDEDKKDFQKLAESFYENKDYKSAIENYTKAIDINTNDPLLYLTYWYRGLSKFELKDYLGALNDYSKAIELEPDDDFIYQSIGDVYSAMKDYKKAIQAFTTCIEKDSIFPLNVYVDRADAKRELNDYEGVIEDLTNAIKSVDEDEYILKTGLFEQRGKAREKLGDIKGSIDDFKKEKENSEKRTKKDYSDLIKEYKECEASTYKDIDAYKEVFKEAQYLLENSIKLSDKQRIELHIMKGNIQDDVRGNFDGAIKEYKKAIKIDSEDWTIWYNLGVCYGRKGEADLAISIYKKVIKLNPESGASYYNRAVQYLTKNEFDYACKDFYNAKKLGIDQANIAIEKYCQPKNLSVEELNTLDFLEGSEE